ncbi:MAG: helix-turn-helix transcriptional regulator [Bdellovibrionales bacterium]|nr:helix-turn-helix transcriptional regulator [Bdellovibrionales bacterium]
MTTHHFFPQILDYQAVGRIFVFHALVTQRLHDMEDLGVIKRSVTEHSPPKVSYELTTLGKKFIPIIEVIADVGQGLVRKSRQAR